MIFKISWDFLRFSPAVLGVALLFSASTIAAEKPVNPEVQTPERVAESPESTAVAESIDHGAKTYLTQSRDLMNAPDSAEISTPSAVTSDTTPGVSTLEQMSDDSTDPMGQVVNVSQLRDVETTDWAYEALRSLVERYGCVAGYPDGSFRGNRALSRYEFAAGMNACLQQIEKLITANGTDAVSKEDLVTLQRLVDEFGTELATLKGRVDTLEGRTTELEANQFSTTTKLNGEVIFMLAGVFGEDSADQDDNPDNNPDLQDNPIFANRVRLNFDTSFTGKDRLRTRLQARNITPFEGNITGTRMTRLSADGDGGNDVEVDHLTYRFPVGDKTTVYLAATTELNNITDTLNPLLESSASGAISRFGRFNPIYRTGGGAGAGVVHKFSDQAELTFSYLAADGEDPSEKNGLFDGSYIAVAQLGLQPIKNLDLGLTYVHSYYAGEGNSGVNLTGSTGSDNARRPFGNVATSADSIGLETNFRISPKLNLSGWVGYSFANSQVTDDDANILNYAVALAFPDLGKKGNLAAIIFGLPPKVIDNSIRAREDDDTSLHIEAFYRFQVTENIAITPGLFLITNPEHNDNNDSIFVGAIRTTFKF